MSEEESQPSPVLPVDPFAHVSVRAVPENLRVSVGDHSAPLYSQLVVVLRLDTCALLLREVTRGRLRDRHEPSGAKVASREEVSRQGIWGIERGSSLLGW